MGERVAFAAEEEINLLVDKAVLKDVEILEACVLRKIFEGY